MSKHTDSEIVELENMKKEPAGNRRMLPFGGAPPHLGALVLLQSTIFLFTLQLVAIWWQSMSLPLFSIAKRDI